MDKKTGEADQIRIGTYVPSKAIHHGEGLPALDILTTEDTQDWTAAEERKVLRKIDFAIVPLLGICYMFQLLDKTTLTYASILGIIKDVHLVGSQYSWAASIFYFGYIAFSYPTSIMIVKFPIGKYVSITVIIWAAIVMCHAACNNWSSLMAVRFFLGIAEATVAPAFAILVGTFYKRSEQPIRQTLWFAGNALAGAVGGLTAYGIGHITGGLAAWRCLFLIFGGVTVLWGAVMLAFLPDDPSTARFLDTHQRSIAVRRLLTSPSMKSTVYKKDQVWDALTDPQVWLLVVVTFCVNVGNGGIATFGSLIINGFGYDVFTTLLLQLSISLAQFVFIGIGALGATYIKNGRIATMAFMLLLSVTGVLLMFKVPPSNPRARMAGVCFTVAYVTTVPLSLSVVTSNIAGYTKKSTTMSMIFIAFCVGNIAGPQFFITSEAPNYPTGMTASLSCFGLGVFFLLVLRVYLMWSNKRNAADPVVVAAVEAEVEAETDGKVHEHDVLIDEDVTDRKIKGFQYVM